MKKRNYLACVAMRYESDYVINTARCISEDDTGSHLEVISIMEDAPATMDQAEAIDHLSETARQADAPMTVLYSSNTVLAAVEYIKRHKITHVIAGMPSSGESEGDFITLLRAVLPKVNILLIPQFVSVQVDIEDDYEIMD